MPLVKDVRDSVGRRRLATNGLLFPGIPAKPTLVPSGRVLSFRVGLINHSLESFLIIGKAMWFDRKVR